MNDGGTSIFGRDRKVNVKANEGCLSKCFREMQFVRYVVKLKAKKPTMIQPGKKAKSTNQARPWGFAKHAIGKYCIALELLDGKPGELKGSRRVWASGRGSAPLG